MTLTKTEEKKDNWRNTMFKSGVGKKIGFALMMALIIVLTPWEPLRGDDLKKAIELVVAMNTAATKSQGRIDKIDAKSDNLITRYREIHRQMESLQVYKEQIEKLVVAQRTQMDDLQQQINDAAMVGRGITPLMFRMIESLEEFIKLDVPFLPEERTNRVAELRKMMNNSEVSDSAKYRRILEAYQIENEYGRTVEAYKGEIKTGDKTRTVDFMKIGRVIFIYRTLDNQKFGMWNQQEMKWRDLPSKYANAIKKGFRISRRQAASDLIPLPVPAAKEVQ
ncbi:MAG: DUF3450 domain-containing protein [Proteobacteria bacterium]|nr:DUF3450 domain-containing protein [Pseudomonadota bacterium]